MFRVQRISKVKYGRHLDFDGRRYREDSFFQSLCVDFIIYSFQIRHSYLVVFLLIRGFTSASFISRFLVNRNWSADFLPLTRTTGRTSLYDSTLYVSSFTLVKPGGPCCFAAPLTNVFPPVGCLLLFLLGHQVIIILY